MLELFTRDLGFRWSPSGTSYVGVGTIRPEVCVPGTKVVSAAFLATCADILTGVLCTQGILPDVAVTVDLRVSLVNAPSFGAFTGRSYMVKRGRTISIGRAEFRDAYDRLFAIAHAAFSPAPEPLEVPLADFNPSDIREALTELRTLLGCRHPSPHAAEVDCSPTTLNPSGAMQGGVHAFLAEAAATDAGRVAQDLEVRYMRPIVHGPARAEVVSSSAGSLQTLHRIDITDGSSAQLAAVAMVSTVPSAAIHQTS